MIDTMYVNGCSWTSGNELELDPSFSAYLAEAGLHVSTLSQWNIVDADNKYVDRVSRHWDKFNWAGKLATKLSIPLLINESLGGGSNARIVRKTTEYVLQYPEEKRKNLFVIIGWTVSARNEVFIDNGKGPAEWVYFNSSQQFSKGISSGPGIRSDANLKESMDAYQKHFIVSIENDYAHIHRYMLGVYLLANLLENLKIKYFFFSALPPWWSAGNEQCKIDATSLFSKELAWQDTKKQILNYKDSMYDFVEKYKFPKAPMSHPLVGAHDAWSDYILSVIEERSLLE